MRLIHTFFTLIIPIVLCAQDGQKIHLTGNPSADFFCKNFPLFSEPSVFDQESYDFGTKEKSPWLAGFLSLVVPGAGQAYTESYLKGALFFAAEATFWTVAIIYDKKGNDQTRLFEDYANTHWSVVRYARWVLNNQYTLNPYLTQGISSEELFNDNFDPENGGCGPPFRCVKWRELNRLEDSVSRNTGNGFTHRLPPHGDQQYYELIGKYHQYSRGWDDEDLDDVELPIRSNGKRFYEYSRMRKNANDYYDVASLFVSVAVVNHVASALDAFFTARRYNNGLRAEVRMKLLPTYSGVVPYTEAKIKYQF